MTKQWQELKATITEMRDNGGTGTQQDVCRFLINYMETLEKQIQEPRWIPAEPYVPDTNVGKIAESEDCISKQAVIDKAFDFMDDDCETYRAVYVSDIRKMPSVTPQASEEDIHREREQAYMLGYEDASKKFRTEPCEDCVSIGVFEQCKWERDTAIEQLNQLGYGLGEKIKTDGDYISREQVKKLICEDNDNYGYSIRFHNFTKKCLSLPTVKNSKWIPVTERLPENTEYVLAFDGEDYFVAWYEVQNIEMQGWHSWDKSFDRYYSIKAWMPIESYTEVDDDE